MYRKHFALTHFPFDLELEPEALFASATLAEAEGRLKHLLELRAIGLVTGEAGSGKTTVCRKIAAALHPGLYRVFYVPLSTGNVMDMYKSIGWELGLPTERNRASAFRVIRAEITRLTLEAKQRPVLIIDEAHHLRNEILEDLRLLTNYEMDSQNRLCLLLVGMTELRRRLAMAVHESACPTHRGALPPGRARPRGTARVSHPSPALGRLRITAHRATRRRGPVPGHPGYATQGQPPGSLRAYQRRPRQSKGRLYRACTSRPGGDPSMNKTPPGSLSAYAVMNTFELPQHWSAEQALAVWELLEALATLVWDQYELPLLELIRPDLYEQDPNPLDRFDPDDDIPF